MIDHYDWAGGREAMIRLGPDTGPVVIVALPLFEEANRTRTFAMTMMRALATRGVASVLPDLPGTGDSETATETVTLAEWRGAFAAAARATGAGYAVAIRSGTLLDSEADLVGRWHLAPQDGASLVRELRRLQDDTGRIAGNAVHSELLDSLSTMEPEPARTIRLCDDPRPADRKVDAAPLWRRSEPGNDPALAATLADDIVEWVRSCAG